MSTTTFNGHGTTAGIKRHTKDFACPICGGRTESVRGQSERCWGFSTDDGWVHCTREQYAGLAKFHPTSETWAHRLHGKCPCGTEHNPELGAPARSPKHRKPKSKPKEDLGPIVATYDYTDEQGEVLFQVVRYEPKGSEDTEKRKDFRQRRPDPSRPGQYIDNIDGVRRVLYRLPELKAANPAELVFLPEGERDADGLASLWLVSTTNSGGSGKWDRSYTECLAGRDVVICPDRDKPDPNGRETPGEKHLRIVGAALHGKVRRLRVLWMPDGFKDAAAWLESRTNFTPEENAAELRRLAAEAPDWTPPVEADGPSSDRPEIVCGEEDPSEGLKTWTPKALEALGMRNNPPYMFQQNDALVRLRFIDGAAPSVDVLGPVELIGELDRAANWARAYTTSKGERKVKYGLPRPEVASDILALPGWDVKHFPHLELVTETPRFLPGGTLTLRPGYYPDHRLFYRPTPDVAGLAVPQVPSPGEVRDARSLLLDNIFVDFRFADGDASRANALACMLLPFVRLMIDGPTPNHHFSASSEGNGKTLLARACAYSSIGRILKESTPKESDAEWRKSLTTELRNNPTHIFFDNLYNPIGWEYTPMPIDSGSLAMAWTSRVYNDRILGGNKGFSVKVNSVFMSTGNNIEFSRELTRRIVYINLRTTMENPSQRTGFKHEDLLDWCGQHRLELLRACLILVQHWIAVGMPAGTRVMGSFEGYARTMGGILDAIGVPGFLINQAKAIKADPEANRWQALVTSWHQEYGTRPILARELVTLINKQEHAELSDTFADTLGSGDSRSQAMKMGKALIKHKDRVWGEWRIVRAVGAKFRSGATLYKLQDPAEEVADEPDEVPLEGEI